MIGATTGSEKTERAELFDHGLFRDGSGYSPNLAPLIEDDHGRDTPDTEHRRRPWVLIDVQLADPDPPGQICRQLLDEGTDHQTRSAPASPEVDEDRPT